MTFHIYFWISFGVSMWALLSLPTRLSPGGNLFGSAILSLFGFALWPVFLAAMWKSRAP